MANQVSPLLQLPSGEQRPVTCSQCNGTVFTQETSKTESRWGFTQHKMTLFICTTCSHIETFYEDRVIFFGQVG